VAASLAAARARLLLSLLAGAVAAAAALLLAGEALGRLAAARAAAGRLEERLVGLRGEAASLGRLAVQRDALRATVGGRLARRYAPGEITPYGFAAIVTAALAEQGIVVGRYQVVEAAGGAFVDVTATGGAGAFAEFLRSVPSRAKLWTLPSLTLKLRPADGTLEAGMRIACAVATRAADPPPPAVSGAGSTADAAAPAPVPADVVIALFLGPAPERSAALPPTGRPSRVDWLQYLGRSIDAGGVVRVFVKDGRTGGVIVAGADEGAWRLVAEEESSVTLGRGTELYEVPRR
jgi:hypothetical protein